MTQPDQYHTKFREIIHDIQRLTAFHGNLGLEYQQSNDLNQLLASQKTSQLRPKTPSPQTTQTRKQTTSKPKQTLAPISTTDLDNCRQLIEQCNSCPHRIPPKFGIGTTNRPFLFIICDGNSSDPSRPMEEAEESLLGKMLHAIKIKPTQIFVTNLIKCKTKQQNGQTSLEMAGNCLSHTRQQIRLMQPLMICTMGQLSSQIVLQSTNQLMALRGHFHSFMDIPLMATYHPAQLIALAELKKATWYDLQLMQRKLAMDSSKQD